MRAVPVPVRSGSHDQRAQEDHRQPLIDRNAAIGAPAEEELVEVMVTEKLGPQGSELAACTDGADPALRGQIVGEPGSITHTPSDPLRRVRHHGA